MSPHCGYKGFSEYFRRFEQKNNVLQISVLGKYIGIRSWFLVIFGKMKVGLKLIKNTFFFFWIYTIRLKIYIRRVK